MSEAGRQPASEGKEVQLEHPCWESRDLPAHLTSGSGAQYCKPGDRKTFALITHIPQLSGELRLRTHSLSGAAGGSPGKGHGGFAGWPLPTPAWPPRAGTCSGLPQPPRHGLLPYSPRIQPAADFPQQASVFSWLISPKPESEEGSMCEMEYVEIYSEYIGGTMS